MMTPKVGGSMSEGEARGLIHAADKDNSGGVDFNEFSRLWSAIRGDGQVGDKLWRGERERGREGERGMKMRGKREREGGGKRDEDERKEEEREGGERKGSRERE